MISLNTSYSAVLLSNSFGLSISQNIFILPSFLRIFLLSIGFRLRSTFFSFGTINFLIYCLLICTISSEKSAAIFIFVPLYIMCLFFLWLRLRLSFHGYWANGSDVCWCSSLQVSYARSSLSFLDLWVYYSLHQT